MSPSELNWPICPKKGFLVNPEKRCPKCKQKKFLKWNNDRSAWECKVAQEKKQ